MFQMFSSGSPRYETLEVDWEAWEGRLGVFVRTLRTMRVVYRVNVSESSGTGSPGLSWIKCHYTVVVANRIAEKWFSHNAITHY